MPTINHTYYKNVPPYLGQGTGNAYITWWLLTRAMKKAGWKYKASGDGSTKDITGDPALDKWNITPGSVGPITNVGATSAVIAAPSRGRATITGLSSISSTDKGRFIKISGSATSANNNVHQIEEVLSATSVRIDARQFAVAADATPRAWEIRDPQGDTFNGKTGWWLGQGPSILKIPFSIQSTVDFARGENIVQATTGAEAQVISVFYESGAGYIVATPRVRGTGADPRGWGTGNVVTSAGGASITQVGVVKEYVVEIIISQSSPARGAIAMSCGFFDYSTDTGFQSAAVLTAAAANSPPAMQTFGYCIWSSSGTNGAQDIARGEVIANFANSMGMVADCIEESGYSADGSFYGGFAMLTTGNTQFHGIGFSWLDDPEAGDLFPFTSYGAYEGSLNMAVASPAYARTTMGTAGGGSNIGSSRMAVWSLTNGDSPARPMFRTWRRRGLSGDQFLCCGVLNYYAQWSAAGEVYIYRHNPTNRWNQATPAITSRQLIKLAVWSAEALIKTAKGNVRWLRMGEGGIQYNVYTESASRGWIQLESDNATGVGPFVVGPWTGGVDGLANG